MGVDSKPRFLDGLIAHPPKHEPEEDETEGALKERRGPVPTPMLDFIFRDGRVRSLSYAYLADVDFMPGDMLTLRFTSGALVHVEGRNLERLRQSVRLHRANKICEGSQTELMPDGQGAAQVERIQITEGDMK